MTTIAGASRYLNAATLANQQGLNAQQPNFLEQTVSSSLLDAGRTLAVRGIGLSARSRALTQQFLNRTADVNKMFSLAGGTSASVEAAQQQILALRAGLSDDQLARSLRSDNGGVSQSANGQTVDQEA